MFGVRSGVTITCEPEKNGTLTTVIGILEPESAASSSSLSPSDHYLIDVHFLRLPATRARSERRICWGNSHIPIYRRKSIG